MSRCLITIQLYKLLSEVTIPLLPHLHFVLFWVFFFFRRLGNLSSLKRKCWKWLTVLLRALPILPGFLSSGFMQLLTSTEPCLSVRSKQCFLVFTVCNICKLLWLLEYPFPGIPAMSAGCRPYHRVSLWVSKTVQWPLSLTAWEQHGLWAERILHAPQQQPTGAPLSSGRYIRVSCGFACKKDLWKGKWSSACWDFRKVEITGAWCFAERATRCQWQSFHKDVSQRLHGLFEILAGSYR